MKSFKKYPGLAIIALVTVFIFPGKCFSGAWENFEPPMPGIKTALAALIDDDGTWLGYANYGLVQYEYPYQIKRKITPKEGLPGPTVTDLAKRDTELWIGTSDGLACLSKGGGLKAFTVKEGLPDNGITCLAVSGATVFAGTMKGLARYKGDSFDIISEEKGLPSAHITALSPSPLGLLIGTTKGWGILSRDAVEPHTPEIDRLPFEWITSIAYYKYRKAELSEDSNVSNDWIVMGTAGGGLIFYHDKSYKSLKKDDDGPGADWITCLNYLPETANLWVGSQNGFAVLDITTDVWRKYSAADSGLPNDFVKDISVRVIDTPIEDYEILMGKGRCPGAAEVKAYLASCAIAASSAQTLGQTSTGTIGVASGQSGTFNPASGSLTASSSASAGAILQFPDCVCKFKSELGVCSCESWGVDGCQKGLPCPGKAQAYPVKRSEGFYCRLCNTIPPKKKPRILHVYQTWAAIGTIDGAVQYYYKELPHFGQGNIYCYLSSLGWAVQGVGIGQFVFAGVSPPGVAEGFLFYFDPPRIKFSSGWPNPPETRFSTVINTLGMTPDGNPVAGGYSLGRGGLAILDLQEASRNTSASFNPWQIFGSKEGLTDLNVTCTFKEGASILVGTGSLGKSGSVFRFRDGRFERLPVPGLKYASNSSMFRAPVTCLWGDEKRAYVGTKGDGLYYFDGDTWTRTDSFSNKTLSDDDIRALTFRDNLLMVGTKKGLDFFSNELNFHFEPKKVNGYSNDVQGLLWDDSEGDERRMILWVGHHNGFSRISLEEGRMVHGGRGITQSESDIPWPGNPPRMAHVFVESWPGNPREHMPDLCPFDGLPGRHITGMAYDDINLWIGTENGICRFRK